MTTILSPEDCEKIGKEFKYRCRCGSYISSDYDLTCPDCSRAYVWPDTPGYKRLLKQQRNAAADLKAKERERKMSPTVSYVLLVARMGELDVSKVFVKSYLGENEQANKDQGYQVLTEMEWLNSVAQGDVEAKAMELHNAGEHGRGLIVHLVNWISKTGGSFKPTEVAPQPNVGDTSAWTEDDEARAQKEIAERDAHFKARQIILHTE